MKIPLQWKCGFKVLVIIFASVADAQVLVPVPDPKPLVGDEISAEGISPITLVASSEGDKIYVAETARKQIAVLKFPEAKEVATISLPERPTGLVLSPDGSKLYVTTESPNGSVLVIHPDTGQIEAKWRVGHTPGAPVLSLDGILYVCNRFDNNVSVLDTVSGHEVTKIPVEREPVAAVLTPDGKTLFVANLLPNGEANADYIGASVSVIDIISKQTTTIPLFNGTSSVRGVCVSPDGLFAYAVHIVGHYQQPTIRVEGGWMNVAALAVIDVKAGKLVNTVLLDDEGLGAANPWAVACSKDGRYLCVTHAGPHEISVIDRVALQARLDQCTRGEKDSIAPENVPKEFSFLDGIRRRIKLAGNGPRGLVLIDNKAYAAEYFSDSIGIVDILAENKAAARSVQLGSKAQMSAVRKGEMLFNDATLCREQWQSCASCHPDGRADGLNWDLLNDGIGNPKNAKSLLLAHRTPPSMWLGVRKSAEEGVRAGLRYIEFNQCREEDASDIDAYLKSLEPVRSPHLVNGKLSESAERGKKVFEKADCIACHTPPLFTNNSLYDLGFGTGIDKGKPFVVPTLIEVWRTAPYLHDGRAATMREVVTNFNKADSHGATSTLTKQEINDLVEYVLSL
jgi:YVTN family beta-propeller protein